MEVACEQPCLELLEKPLPLPLLDLFHPLIPYISLLDQFSLFH